MRHTKDEAPSMKNIFLDCGCSTKEEVEKLSNISKQRDATLQNLLAEIKKLNAKVQDIRAELKV